MAGHGLSEANRGFVAQLNRRFRGPFTVVQAAEATGTDHGRAARLLRHLAEQGWVARVQRGLYTVVPLEAEDPQSWAVDPWAIAASALEPGYIGGWTALHNWDLTDQVFSTTVFVTGRSVPSRRREIGGARFELRHRSKRLLFGTKKVWREGVPVEVSDPARTLVDCLDDPSLGGGLQHVVEALSAYAEGPNVDWGKLIGYGDRFGNRSIFKRLGYLAEARRLADDQVVSACLARISAGTSRLDPTRPPGGRVFARWRLQVNARIDG